MTLSAQSGIEIVSLEHGLSEIRVRAVATTSVSAALRQLLRGTPYRAIAIAGGWRIVRHRAQTAQRGTGRRDVSAGEDIVVTAGKQNQSLLRYPGSVTLAADFPDRGEALPARDLDDVARATPVLQTTSFGEGRNKLFIRGIADSSFNGATQSPTSVYFGDAQLGFASPNPSVKLYDIKRIEILEGPQGTLYGSGAIGGIIRIEPNGVDLSRIAASASFGTTLGLRTEAGYDAGAMINVPMFDETAGVRGVAYRTRDGGILDLRDRGLLPNQVDTEGARLAIRINAGGWDVEASGLVQDTTAQNSQYTEAGPLQMRTAGLAQPFSNMIQVGRLVVEHDWGAQLKLFASTSFVVRHSLDTFDATTATARPTVYTISRSALLFAQEVRLLREWHNGGSWVIGASYLRARDAQARSLGIPDSPVELDEVTNITYALSGFAQATVPLTSRLQLTLGSRVTYARTDGEPATARGAAPTVRGIPTTRIDPTAAISWQAAPRLSLFARVQTGYRTGGIAVARGIGRVADFKPDSIVMGEIGIRRIGGLGKGPSFSLGAAYADWTGIQADLISARGLPYTVNLGNARIATVEAASDWEILNGLTISGAALFADTRLSGSMIQQSNSPDKHLPDTPAFSASGSIGYRWQCWRAKCRAKADYRYTGRSVLGPGALLDLTQGDYAVIGANAAVTIGRYDLSLSADNLTNSRANMFAFGNPLAIATRNQIAPLRPLALRLGLSIDL
jgi:outer membrane receptor protein involved in Fe transport